MYQNSSFSMTVNVIKYHMEEREKTTYCFAHSLFGPNGDIHSSTTSFFKCYMVPYIQGYRYHTKEKYSSVHLEKLYV